jgi:two-component system, sporulation sensor kinase B
MEITEHLFFNLCLIFIMLFYYLLWTLKRSRFQLSRKALFFWLLIMLVVCFQFSYQPGQNLHFDLRVIPIVLGGLYGGIGPILAITFIIFRGIHGIELGFLYNSFLYSVLAVFFWKAYPWFWKQTSNVRITFSVLLVGVISIVTAVSFEIMCPPVNHFDLWLAYLLVPTIGIGMITYSIEAARKLIQIQQKIVKTEKLEVVEQMGAAISHEIRNPLTAVSGFIQLLRENTLDQHKQSEYLDIIKEELDAAERVIKNYLTFAKPSIVSVEELNVEKEISHLLSIILPIANQNSVKISTEYSTPNSIQGDRQQFHQCLLNVLKNAIESMPGGGLLLIKTESLQDKVIIRISDNGIGMSKEQVLRLGEPYYSTKGSKGTGLGMMVVYSIVRALNGVLSVQSELGSGTEFSFSFPRYYSPGNKMSGTDKRQHY